MHYCRVSDVAIWGLMWPPVVSNSRHQVCDVYQSSICFFA
jgi:hypothetical protein